MLTPVENAFSAWKWKVKNQLAEATEQASFSDPDVAHQHGMNLAQWRRTRLQALGEEALSVVTAEKCLAWQNHCMSYFPKCFAMDDILV